MQGSVTPRTGGERSVGDVGQDRRDGVPLRIVEDLEQQVAGGEVERRQARPVGGIRDAELHRVVDTVEREEHPERGFELLGSGAESEAGLLEQHLGRGAVDQGPRRDVPECR